LDNAKEEVVFESKAEGQKVEALKIMLVTTFSPFTQLAAKIIPKKNSITLESREAIVKTIAGIPNVEIIRNPNLPRISRADGRLFLHLDSLTDLCKMVWIVEETQGAEVVALE
jgi:hypothetical protein